MLLGFRSGPCVRERLLFCPLSFRMQLVRFRAGCAIVVSVSPSFSGVSFFSDVRVPSLSHGGAPVPFQKSACSGFSTETHTRKSPDGTAGVFQRGGGFAVVVLVWPWFPLCPTVELLFPSKSLPVLDSPPKHTHEKPQMGQQASFKEGGGFAVVVLVWPGNVCWVGIVVLVPLSPCVCVLGRNRSFGLALILELLLLVLSLLCVRLCIFGIAVYVPSLSHGGAPVPFQKSACSGFSTETHTRKSPDGTAGVFQRGGGFAVVVLVWPGNVCWVGIVVLVPLSPCVCVLGRNRSFGLALILELLLLVLSLLCVRFPLCPTVELLFPSKSLPVLDSPPKHTHENPQMGQQASFKEGGVPSLSHGGAPVPFQKSACSGFSTETHTRKTPDGQQASFKEGG
ncbi:hypothetical protein TNCT_621261, partial [Trichonephila clavata]